MFKVNEKVDLSKKVLDINIDSQIFDDMRNDLNKEILRCIKKVYDKDFASGEISLKLNIEIPNAYKNFSKENHLGELVTETYTYRTPKFKHSVTTTLKKQFKQEGTYFEEREVQFEDGKFVAAPVKIKDEQMSIEGI
ncbi:hypothetical protein [Clostridium sp. OS1-26]|uniref:hypothetical protein n=1 Tax=Clostridium sp. OS1-26 TaxID=3070681 RepID=UPI0027DEF0A5|nr:hypothetical protein [Clostridium sp. OS1-26]WML35367.1 hypothetical protein RCG18_00985 [Clostridium sp. OS1-26]